MQNNRSIDILNGRKEGDRENPLDNGEKTIFLLTEGKKKGIIEKICKKRRKNYA